MSITKGIKNLKLASRVRIFSKLSEISYLDYQATCKLANGLGFYDISFYDNGGAQAYLFNTGSDKILVFRGTEVSELNDIIADLRMFPINKKGLGRVHKGFIKEVEDLLDLILKDIPDSDIQCNLWITGHSLGAAMALIMARICEVTEGVLKPVEVVTFGSPRVGWRSFTTKIQTLHRRFVNNNDIIVSLPPAWLGYKHHGKTYYFNAYGQLRDLTVWQLIKDKFRGIIKGLVHGKIDNLRDHSIKEYNKIWLNIEM